MRRAHTTGLLVTGAALASMGFTGFWGARGVDVASR